MTYAVIKMISAVASYGQRACLLWKVLVDGTYVKQLEQ